jgi:hypothetical protein
MGPIPFALSISHFVSSVGADAGFAAIIGLAILILLYFAQARETANMRERLAEAGDHVRQLEQRLAQIARGSANGQTSPPAPAPASAVQARSPAPASAAAPSASRVATGGSARVPASAGAAVAVAPAVAPSAPAGVGAPALSAATRLIPAGGHDAQAIRAAAATASPPAPPSSPPPAPSTAAGGANGASAAPSPSAGGPGQVDRPYRIAGAPDPSPAPAGRGPGSGVRAQPPRRLLDPEPASSRLRSVLLALGGLIAVAAVVVVLLVVTSSGSSSHNSAKTSAISNAPRAGRRGGSAGAALKPAKVTVAVLNGTATTNLAHDVSTRLGGFGYKLGAIATATDQTETTTTVGYRPDGRRAALLVARSLNLGAASVQPVNPSNEAVACPQTTACTAQVVVTVGSDLASFASSSSTTG